MYLPSTQGTPPLIKHQTSDILHCLSLFPFYFCRISFGKSRSRFGVSSGITEENHKESRRIPEESTAKPEGIWLFPEAVPKAATLLGVFYDENELFFISYELIVNGLAGVAPPPPPLMPVFIL
jgi:hypothetical protein